MAAAATTKPKIGVLGSGDVGKTLARGFFAAGYKVMISAREGEKNEKLKKFVSEEGKGIEIGVFADAVKFGNVVILATHFEGGATENAIKVAGGGVAFEGKVVIDTTNPLKADATGIWQTQGIDTSAGEQVQALMPKAHVVKAFNSMGFPVMINPSYKDGHAHHYICGENADAKKTVITMLNDVGWRDHVQDLGGIKISRVIEPLSIVWCNIGLVTGKWNHAFALLTK